jgi:hypothetical protein
LCFSSHLEANSISFYEAQTALNNWLLRDDLHMGESLGKTIINIKFYTDGRSGNIGYYLIILDKGWVVLPADDRFWPIQTFGSGTMTYEVFEGSMWFDLLRYSGESINTTRGAGIGEDNNETTGRNQMAWAALLQGDLMARGAVRKETLPSGDIRVEPFLGVETFWGQSEPFNSKTNFLYLMKNYQTSQFTNLQFPVGCVPLTTAQMVHYLITNQDLYNNTSLAIPANPPLGGYTNLPLAVSRDWGTQMFPNFEYQLHYSDAILRPNTYQWDMMAPAFPLNTTTIIPAISSDVDQFIAPLLHDIGLYSTARYSDKITLAPLLPDIYKQLGVEHVKQVGVYRLTSDDFGLIPENARKHIIRTNLDMGMPVVVSYGMYHENASLLGGHVAVVDGYGFAPTTTSGGQINYDGAYYHIVTGQSRLDPLGNNQWQKDPGGWSFSMVDNVLPAFANENDIININEEILFNVFLNMSDFKKAGGLTLNNPELVSGRVLSRDHTKPVRDATVAVSWDNSEQYEVISNENGIYAFAVPASKDITILVKSPDNTYAPINQHIGETLSNPILEPSSITANYPNSGSYTYDATGGYVVSGVAIVQGESRHEGTACASKE